MHHWQLRHGRPNDRPAVDMPLYVHVCITLKKKKKKTRIKSAWKGIAYETHTHILVRMYVIIAIIIIYFIVMRLRALESKHDKHYTVPALCTHTKHKHNKRHRDIFRSRWTLFVHIQYTYMVHSQFSVEMKYNIYMLGQIIYGGQLFVWSQQKGHEKHFMYTFVYIILWNYKWNINSIIRQRTNEKNCVMMERREK